MDARSKLAAALLAGMGMLSACSDDPVSPPPPPGPTVDLSGYFLLPDTTWNKFFTTGSQTYVKDSSLNGDSVVVVSQPDGQIDYFLRSSRAWAAFHTSTLFEISPALAGLPDDMPTTADHVAQADILTQPDLSHIVRRSRLIDTGLTVTVGAGTFDSVVRLRQEVHFTQIILGAPSTTIDSAYRWYAPGVDEIRTVRWQDGQSDSTLREFTGGVVGGRTYP